MANIALYKSVSLYTRSQLGLGTSSRPAEKPDEYDDSLYLGGGSWDYVGSNSPKNSDGWRDPNIFRYRDIQFTECTDGAIINSYSDNRGIPYWYWKSILQGPEGTVTRWRKDVEEQPKGYPYVCATGTHGVTRPASQWTDINNDIDRQMKLDEMEASAIMYVLKSCRDSPIHMGMFLAGLPESIRMIAETATVISRAMTALRRGDFNRVAQLIAYGSRSLSDKSKKSLQQKILRKKGIPKSDLERLDRMERGTERVNESFVDTVTAALSSKWLEINFGWLNLYSDVKGLFEALPSVLEVENLPRVTGRAVRHDTIDSQVYSDIRRANRTYGLVYELGGSATRNITMIIRCDWKVGSPGLYLANRFGLLNPLEIVWDRVPFSFVVDWFFPVSGLIQSLTAEAGLRFLGGSKTISQVTTYDMFQYLIPSEYSRYRYTVTGGRINYKIRSHSVERDTYSSAPAIPMRGLFRLPDSMWHGLTSLALLRQRFSKCFTFGGR